MGVSDKHGSAIEILGLGNTTTNREFPSVSTDALWGRHKMPVVSSVETGVGYESGSVDPMDAAHTWANLLRHYTVRSRSALMACARLVGLFASLKCTTPIAGALGRAGCCDAIMTALNVNDENGVACRHILYAIGGLASSSTTAADNTFGGGDTSDLFQEAKRNSGLLSDAGAIKEIDAVIKANYEIDLEVCMIGCKAIYFLTNSVGFSTNSVIS